MINDYTIFTTYLLAPTTGFSKAIHCNYINSLVISTDNLSINDINLSFSGGSSDFKFLSTDITTGTGYTANRIYMLIQTGLTSTAKPIASAWKIIEVTSQISGLGAYITPINLQNTKFMVSLSGYSTYSAYTLNYLDYPSNQPSANDLLCFGDEIFFLGNVSTTIHADVYTTNLSIILPANQYNSSSNATWGGGSVYATEVGLFDGNGNLVAIGKFNDPMEKSSNISRTVLFAIDF